MVTYQDIQAASATIRTMDVKGKEYAIVNERIRAFRMVYPGGAITTDIVSMADGVVVMKATVCAEDGTVLGTGTAYEKEGSSYINKTSYIENCETSAVGRALGMCGFGIDTAVCSAEEVKNAIRQQENTDDNPLGVRCAHCGELITDTVYGGKNYTAAQICKSSKEKYGVYLHIGCKNAWEEAQE